MANQSAPDPVKAKRNWKIIGGVIAAVFVVGIASQPKKPADGAAGASQEAEAAPKEEKRKEAPAPAPAIEVTARALFAEYEANEVAADMKFKGKQLAVTGTVASINKDFKGDVWVGLATENEFMPVHAEGFSPNQVADLKKGQKIKITCTGKGMIVGSPMLKKCS